MKRKIYSYILHTASGDYYHVLSGNNYEDVYDFMKNEVPEEYSAWKDEWDTSDGPWDETTIDYQYYDKVGVELNGINGPLKEI